MWKNKNHPEAQYQLHLRSLDPYQHYDIKRNAGVKYNG